MEHQLIVQFGVVWLVIIITLTIIWIFFWIQLAHYLENKIDRIEMADYLIYSHQSEMMPKPDSTPHHQECKACIDTKDTENVPHTQVHNTSNIRGIPPDIFIINEEGKTIKYIMCV